MHQLHARRQCYISYSFINSMKLYLLCCYVSVPSHDAALQQVVLLKKELAEIKAKQAVSDTSVTSVINSTMMGRQDGGHSGSGVQHRAEVDMERSSHRETIEALELSENSVSLCFTMIYLA